MLDLLSSLFAAIGSGFRSRHALVLENLAMRQQLAVLKRTTRRPKLTNADRAFLGGAIAAVAAMA